MSDRKKEKKKEIITMQWKSRLIIKFNRSVVVNVTLFTRNPQSFVIN